MAEEFPGKHYGGELLRGGAALYSLSYRGPERFQGMVKQGISNDGLHMSAAFPFSLVRSDIWIPRGAISVCGENSVLVHSMYTQISFSRSLGVGQWCEQQGIPVVGYNEFKRRYMRADTVEFALLGAYWSVEGLRRTFESDGENLCRDIRLLIGPRGWATGIGFVDEDWANTDSAHAARVEIRNHRFKLADKNVDRKPVWTTIPMMFVSPDSSKEDTSQLVADCIEV